MNINPTRPRFAWVVLMLLAFSAGLPACGNSNSDKSEQAERYYAIGQYSSAMDLWKSIGEKDPRALYMIGFLYQNGLGVREDEREAIKWYMKAMDMGYAKSGLKLYEILSSQGSVEAAIHYLRSAARKGQTRAQTLLAEIYWREGERDKYYKWIGMAIDQGDLTARVINEIRESESTGAPLSDAAKVFKKVMSGDADAYYQYGLIVMSDKGGGNISMAVNMFQSAAKLGHHGALYMLGNIYLAGIGVPKSCERALAYYQSASRKGNESAEKK